MSLSQLQAPDKQRLFKGTTQLEDSRKLADMQVGNDDVLAMTFCQSGEGTQTMRLKQPPCFDQVPRSKFCMEALPWVASYQDFQHG